MSKHNTPQTSFRKDTTTIITDIDGDTILEIGLSEYTIKHSDGSRTHRRISETIQLVDGMVWSPAMTKVQIGVCQQCREPQFFGHRTHGLVAMHKAKMCTDGCGRLCCPRHARLGRDKKWRCKEHHRTHLLKTLFHPIFFEPED